MTSHRIPRSLPAAQAMLERYAELEDAIVKIGAARDAAIADANAAADGQSRELIAEREQIAAKLEPWWQAAGPALTQGKRKSIELGGCEIGAVKSRATLAVAADEQDVIERLGALRWAKPFLRTKVSIDRVATLKAVDGSRSAALAELGITRKEGQDVFFVKRAEQEGVRK